MVDGALLSARMASVKGSRAGPIDRVKSARPEPLGTVAGLAKLVGALPTVVRCIAAVLK
jgi:hypothetical protein